MLAPFVTRRYLLGKFWVTIVCVLGILCGVFVLNLVLSVMTGFSSLLKSSIRETLSDIKLSNQSINGFENYEKLMTEIGKIEHVAAVAPRVEGFAVALVEKEHRTYSTEYCRLIGVDPELEGQISSFRKYVGAGLTERNKKFMKEFLGRTRLTREALDYWTSTAQDIVPSKDLNVLSGSVGKVLGREEMEVLTKVAGDTLNQTERDILVRNAGVRLSRRAKVRLLAQAKESRLGINADFKLDGNEVADFPVIPGFEMMWRPRIDRGDKVTLFSFDEEHEPTYMRFTAVNTFRTGVWEYDRRTIYTTLRAAQKFRRFYHRDESGKISGWRVTNLNVKVDDPANLEKARRNIRNWFETEAWRYGVYEEFLVWTWKEERAPYLAAVDLETNLMIVLLAFILFVAGFLIVSLLTLIVNQKTRDIGIMRAVGSSGREIMKIFLGYGLLVGLIGSALGLALSCLAIHNLDGIEAIVGQITGFKPFNREIYNFDRIPREYNLFYMALFFVFGVVTSLAASLYPAVRASRMQPINALRYE